MIIGIKPDNDNKIFNLLCVAILNTAIPLKKQFFFSILLTYIKMLFIFSVTDYSVTL